MNYFGIAMNTPDNQQETNLPLSNTVEPADKEIIESTPVPIDDKLNAEDTEDPTFVSLADLVQALKIVIKTTHSRAEITRLKAEFYKQLAIQHEQEKEAFVAKNSTEEGFEPTPCVEEVELKALLADYKEKRNIEILQAEKAKEQKLEQKEVLLSRLQTIVESNDDVNKTFPIIKEIQQEWRTIGAVSSEKYNALVKKYQLYMEQFYDFLKISNDLRDYDFKKNAEAKTELCEQAEALLVSEDVNKAFVRLQQLHAEWRELGPVSRELREEMWVRFKIASDSINKNHASFFQQRREEEDQNLLRKQELCAKVEALPLADFTSYKSWDEGTQQVLALQQEWKTIGFAPKKNNAKIYERFRQLCDTFFAQKTQFYKESKAVLQENLDKKRVLCEKAEALQNSTDWKAATDEFVQMQQEWKAIGTVSKKVSDQVWKRFIVACDFFFAQKEKEFKGKKSEEVENLAAKKAVIEQIRTYEGKSIDDLKTLMNAYVAIGHVPFKEKDKIYNEYKAIVDAQFTRLKMSDSDKKMGMFKHAISSQGEKSSSGLYREREKLVRAYDRIKADIKTRENNFGFLHATSKKSSPLIQEMEATLEKLKEERDVLLQKIQLLEDTF